MTLKEMAQDLDERGLWMSWSTLAEQKHHETHWTFVARVQRKNKVLTEARADSLNEAKRRAYEQLSKE